HWVVLVPPPVLEQLAEGRFEADLEHVLLRKHRLKARRLRGAAGQTEAGEEASQPAARHPPVLTARSVRVRADAVRGAPAPEITRRARKIPRVHPRCAAPGRGSAGDSRSSTGTSVAASPRAEE